jgi:hypothetical protein
MGFGRNRTFYHLTVCAHSMVELVQGCGPGCASMQGGTAEAAERPER